MPMTCSITRQRSPPLSMARASSVVRLPAAPGLLPRKACPKSRRCQNLHPAVCPSGMGIHDPARHLDHFSDMARQHNSPASLFRCHIQGLSNIIAAFDNSLFFDAVGIPQKRKAIIARRNDQIPAPPGQPYLNLQPDRINQRLLAHRLYPAACPQYGQSAINAKPWLKVFRASLSPSGMDISTSIPPIYPASSQLPTPPAGSSSSAPD